MGWFQLEYKNSGVGKFTQEFSLADDGEESTTNISSNTEIFNELMKIENIKQEQISTNPFLENKVINMF